MPDGRKGILCPFTGLKKQKTWNKTREKYMPVKEDKIQLEQIRVIFQIEMVRKTFRR